MGDDFANTWQVKGEVLWRGIFGQTSFEDVSQIVWDPFELAIDAI
jgi:hypothetical protein